MGPLAEPSRGFGALSGRRLVESRLGAEASLPRERTAELKDKGSSATHHYTVETSTNGTTWTLANEGHFYAANRGHLNSVPLAAGSSAGVRFLRFTMINPMVPEVGNSCTDATNCGDNGVAQRCGPNPPNPGNFGGCTFMDMSEIEVYGRPA